MNLNRRTGLKMAAATLLAGTTLARMAFAQTAAPGDATAPQASYPFDVAGGQVVFHPVAHASMVVETPGGVIAVDPVGGADAYADLPAPTLILITHQHPDHLDIPTLQGLPQVAIIASQTVYDMLPEAMRSRATALANGESAEVIGMRVDAIPAYNLTPERMQYHPQGVGNGYVLGIGGKRFLIAGDTEDTPELRALTDIEVAFLPMNLPYTMSVEQAADAVAEFKPGVVFPYHHRGSDLSTFTRLLAEQAAATTVVIANWYPNGEAAG